MADQRTMAQLLQAPTEGYEDAIVVPAITANNFKLKHGLLTIVQNKQFFRHDKEEPHAHIRYFNKITSTLKFPNVPNTSIKLMPFPFFLEGAAQIWLEKEPPRSIFTWDDLVLKFINQFFPPSKTTNLHQDSLNFAASGNFLDKMPRECLTIILSKSKVRYSRNKPVISKLSTNTSTSGISPDVAELKDMVKALLLDKKSQNQALSFMKAVKESCVSYGGAHSYRNCLATDGHVYHDNIQEFTSQASAVNYTQGNTSYHPLMIALIDVFESELPLRVGKEAITFNLDQTSRYSASYNDMTAKRINVIDMACEEYSQEVLGFTDLIASGNPTPYYNPIVSTTSLTLTPFGNSDFLREEVDAFLALKDDPTSPKVDQSYLDSEGDILLLEAFVNDDPSLPPPNQGNYLPEVRKELKICKAKSDKSSIDEPQRLNSKTYLPTSNMYFWK
nr:reverse transcriptase domain-containing protein [Tanacetum cinerariifolium]